MPRFSESLFESIRNFGRMSPTEGRRRALEQPTQYQQMGTTDPLARSLGKMFGGLGVDTSYLQTGEERAQAAMKKAGEQEFESPEARMIAMLEAQLPTLRPQAQMQAMDQIRQLRTIETQRAAAEAEKKAEIAVAERQETVERGKQNLVRMASDPEFDFANPKQKAGYLSMARAYGVEPKEALELYDSLKPEAKKAVGSRAAPQKVEYINEAGEAVVGMSTMDPTTGDISVEEIGPVIPKEEDFTESAALLKIENTLTQEAREISSKARRAEQLAIGLEKYDPVGGVAGSLTEYIKEVSGEQDAISALRTEASRLTTSEAVANLPKGPASDRDIALVLKGVPPANANAQYLAQYARGIAKMQQAEADYKREQLNWLSKNRSYKGFNAHMTKKKVEEQFAIVPPEALQEMETNINDPVYRNSFIKRFKFDYVQYKQELENANDILEGI
jgi:hypothetical protein